MKKTIINFEDKKSELAHKAWVKAMGIIGGHMVAAQMLGIHFSKFSTITNGQPIKGEEMRKQWFPSFEEAIKISLLTDGKVKAEKLLPNYNFKYIYKYVDMIKMDGSK